MERRTFVRRGIFLICLCALAFILFGAGDAGAMNVEDFYRLKNTKSCPNCQLDGCGCYDLNLSGAHLEGAHLKGADLRNSNLSGAYLQGADLSGSSLRNSNLNGAYLQGADLNGSNLREANLNGANVSGADLSGAHLGGATWTDGTKCDVNWPGCCHASDRERVRKHLRCCIKGTQCH